MQLPATRGTHLIPASCFNLGGRRARHQSRARRGTLIRTAVLALLVATGVSQPAAAGRLLPMPAGAWSFQRCELGKVDDGSAGSMCAERGARHGL